MFSTRRKSVTLLAAAATAAPPLTLAAPPAAHAVASSATCAKVIVVGARGSLESAGSTATIDSGRAYKTGGFGTVAGATAYVQSHYSGTVRSLAIKYPATILPSKNDPGYLNSVAVGTATVRAELNHLGSACPSSKLVLIGYSQGAQIIANVLDWTSFPALSSTAAKNIKAVAFFGDPTYVPFESYDTGGGVLDGLFARSYLGLVNYQSRIRSECLPLDAFCQGWWPLGQDVHASYKQSSYQTAAGKWIVAKL